MSRANPTRLSSLKGKEKDASKTPLRPKTQRSLEDRELNQARSKPNTVNRPVRTVRIFVHHYNSTQYCNTETVFIYIPLPPDQHVSHISPRGSHHTMCGSILPCVGRISVQMWSYLTTGEPHLTMWVTPYRVWVISYHAWVVYQYRCGHISLQVSHISPCGSHHTVCGSYLTTCGSYLTMRGSYISTGESHLTVWVTPYRVWVVSYHVWVISYHAWVVYQYRSGRISLQVSHISPRGSHHTVCGCILPCVGCISVQAWSYLTTDYTTYRVWVISYHVWVVLAQSTQCYNEPSDVWLEQ